MENTFKSIKYIHDRSEFQDSTNETEVRKKMKVFIILKDTLSCLTQSFKFFPPEAWVVILMSPTLLQYLENIYY